MSIVAKPVSPVVAELGEGPVWHDDALWYIDIEQGRLHRLDLSMDWRESWKLDQRLSAAVPAGDGRWVVGMEEGIGLWSPMVGMLEILYRPEADLPRNRCNDGKCDPAGRFYIGTMNMDGEPERGALYRVDPDRSCRKLLEGVSISNGLAWSPELAAMYYIDTGTRRVDVFDWDAGTGDIRNRRPAYEFDESQGFPDGMCIDTNGNLWIAMWGGGCVLCIDPRTGKLVTRVEVPACYVTSCCFGGPELQVLFITTARQGQPPGTPDDKPGAGLVFHARPGATGLPCVSFGLPGS